MEHTPGPYYIKDYDSELHILRKWGDNVQPGDTRTFGSCYGSHIADISYCEGGTASKEQALANARLIAAAPELLEALESILMAHGRYPLDWTEASEKAEVAIAKARGEE